MQYKRFLRKTAAWLLTAALLIGQGVIFPVSAATVAPTTKTTVLDFDDWAVGLKPGSTADFTANGVDRYGWDDGCSGNMAGAPAKEDKFTAEVIEVAAADESEGLSGRAIKWTNLADNGAATLYLNLEYHDPSVTDWTGTTDMLVWVDTSDAEHEVEVEFRLAEADYDANNTMKLQVWARLASGTQYYILENDVWVKAEMNNNRAVLPDGYCGWVRLPINISNLRKGWWTSGAGANDTLDLDEVLYAAVLAQGTTNDVVYFDSISICSVDDWVLEDQGFRFTNMYGDHMIFQQNKDFEVKGYGIVGSTVMVTLKNDTDNVSVEQKTATVAADATWSVNMTKQAGSYDSYSITAVSGSATQTITDVVFGEVWATGGQSNMEWTVARSAEVNDWADKGDGKVRFYLQSTAASFDRELDEPTGTWCTSSDWADVKKASAVGYYFAETLSAELGMPIGFINTAVGGSSLAAWTDVEVAQEDADYYAMLQQYGRTTATSALDRLSGYFNSRVAPFKGYEVSGILWYQGEHERSNPSLQSEGFVAFADSWRRVFGDGESWLPVIQIQVAPYDNLVLNYNLNAAMREGVDRLNAITGTALAVPIYDVEVDLTNIHPPHKQPVGERTAAAALGMVYEAEGFDIYSGPVATGAELRDDGSAIDITFENVGDGLAGQAGAALDGFSVWTGTRYIAVPVTVTSANTVSVSLTDIDRVRAVYYGYGDEIMQANLVNSAGYLSLPFSFGVDDGGGDEVLGDGETLEVFGFEGAETGTKIDGNTKVSGYDASIIDQDSQVAGKGYYTVEVVEPTANSGVHGKALTWTIDSADLRVGGDQANFKTVFKLGGDATAVTNWTGADWLMFYVDASSMPETSYVGLRLYETSENASGVAGVDDLSLMAGQTCYLLADGASVWQSVTSAEMNWWVKPIALPAGFSGWVRVPLSASSWGMSYNGSLKGDGVLSLGQINNISVILGGSNLGGDKATATAAGQSADLLGKSYLVDSFTIARGDNFSVEANRKLGDVNGDGKVTVTDVRQALRAAVGKTTLTGDHLWAADVTGDGKVTVSDVRKILRYAVGKITSFD